MVINFISSRCDGGEVPATQRVDLPGSVVIERGEMERPGYEFYGWLYSRLDGTLEVLYVGETFHPPTHRRGRQTTELHAIWRLHTPLIPQETWYLCWAATTAHLRKYTIATSRLETLGAVTLRSLSINERNSLVALYHETYRLPQSGWRGSRRHQQLPAG